MADTRSWDRDHSIMAQERDRMESEKSQGEVAELPFEENSIETLQALLADANSTVSYSIQRRNRIYNVLVEKLENSSMNIRKSQEEYSSFMSHDMPMRSEGIDSRERY